TGLFHNRIRFAPPHQSAIFRRSFVDPFVETQHMARITDRLTALDVKRLAAQDEGKRANAAPGMYPDGAGLYLRVTKRGASWVLRYMFSGKPRYMGLGPLSLYGL